MTVKGTKENERSIGRTILLFWGPPAAVVFLIFALSSTPGSRFPEHPEILNIFMHFLEFGLLGFFLLRALARGRAENAWGPVMLTICICALLGSMAELLQFTVPQRMFDFMDLLIDFLGAFAGTLIYVNVRNATLHRRPIAGNLSEADDA